MYEILHHLSPGSRVLDIGCRDGSFPAEAYGFQTVRVDLAVPRIPSPWFVQADAVQLPFRSRTFDVVILNHCIEHFLRLMPALQEIGRLVRPDGAAFVSIPDARTPTDRIYRRVLKNAGGHVNRFWSSAELEKTLASCFGLPHVATRTLHSGLAFLNRRNLGGNPAIKEQTQTEFEGLGETALAAISACLRLLDRYAGTRLSVYGWAMYFGKVPEPVDPRPIINVCLRCGEGRRFAEIQAHRAARWGFLLRQYACPACGARNIGLRD